MFQQLFSFIFDIFFHWQRIQHLENNQNNGTLNLCKKATRQDRQQLTILINQRMFQQAFLPHITDITKNDQSKEQQGQDDCMLNKIHLLNSLRLQKKRKKKAAKN